MYNPNRKSPFDPDNWRDAYMMRNYFKLMDSGGAGWSGCLSAFLIFGLGFCFFIAIFFWASTSSTDNSYIPQTQTQTHSTDIHSKNKKHKKLNAQTPPTSTFPSKKDSSDYSLNTTSASEH